MIYGPHNYYDEVRTYLSASPLLGLLLTLVAFQIAVWIHRRCHGNPLTNPIMLAVIVVVGLLKLTGVEYQKYFAGAQFVHFLLGPVTVALAIPLYAQIKPLTRLAGPLLTSLLVGSLIAVLGAWGGSPEPARACWWPWRPNRRPARSPWPLPRAWAARPRSPWPWCC